VATIGIMSDQIRALDAADEGRLELAAIVAALCASMPWLQVRNGSFVAGDFTLSTGGCVQRGSGWSTIPWLRGSGLFLVDRMTRPWRCP
jgi:hypothetical protein